MSINLRTPHGQRFGPQCHAGLASTGELVLCLAGEVNRYMADMVEDDLRSYPRRPVLAMMNSGGGNYEDGLAISRSIRCHGNVTAIITRAGSAMANIAMRCKRADVYADGLLLFHSSTYTFTESGRIRADGLESMASNLRSADDYMVNLMRSKSRVMTAGMARKLMSFDKWIDAPTAREWGLVDRVLSLHAPRLVSQHESTTFDWTKFYNRRPPDAAFRAMGVSAPK